MLEKAISVNDSDEAAHNFLGICFGEKGDFTAAEREIKKAIEINPKYPQAHFNLAILYATAQPPSLELAKQHYKLATELGAEPDASLERLIQ
jgi:Tfp pilus assembly protein PilF